MSQMREIRERTSSKSESIHFSNPATTSAGFMRAKNYLQIGRILQ